MKGFKKLSFVLVFVLVLSMGVSVYAADLTMTWNQLSTETVTLHWGGEYGSDHETTQPCTVEGFTEYLKLRGDLSDDGTLDLSSASVYKFTFTVDGGGYLIVIGEVGTNAVVLYTKDFETASIVPIRGSVFWANNGSMGVYNGKYLVNSDIGIFMSTDLKTWLYNPATDTGSGTDGPWYPSFRMADGKVLLHSDSGDPEEYFEPLDDDFTQWNKVNVPEDQSIGYIPIEVYTGELPKTIKLGTITPAAATAAPSPASGAASTAQATAPPESAIPSASKTHVNGNEVSLDAYNIGGNNYFKLRDLAFVLNGTEKQFNVAWDSGKNAVSMYSQTPYTVVGGEMTAGKNGAKKPALAQAKIDVDGKETELTAYNIDGSNYFKLRDIAKIFDFGVAWDGMIVINTAEKYTEN